MIPLEMIAEWRRGCSCAGPRAPERETTSPVECIECTEALVDAIEKHVMELDPHRAMLRSTAGGLSRTAEALQVDMWRAGLRPKRPEDVIPPEPSRQAGTC